MISSCPVVFLRTTIIIVQTCTLCHNDLLLQFYVTYVSDITFGNTILRFGALRLGQAVTSTTANSGFPLRPGWIFWQIIFYIGPTDSIRVIVVFNNCKINIFICMQREISMAIIIIIIITIPGLGHREEFAFCFSMNINFMQNAKDTR